MPRRSEVSWAMYHQARTRSSSLTAARNRSSFRFPRVGACTFAFAIASAIDSARTSGPWASIFVIFSGGGHGV